MARVEMQMPLLCTSMKILQNALLSKVTDLWSLITKESPSMKTHLFVLCYHHFHHMINHVSFYCLICQWQRPSWTLFGFSGNHTERIASRLSRRRRKLRRMQRWRRRRALTSPRRVWIAETLMNWLLMSAFKSWALAWKQYLASQVGRGERLSGVGEHCPNSLGWWMLTFPQFWWTQKKNVIVKACQPGLPGVLLEDSKSWTNTLQEEVYGFFRNYCCLEGRFALEE